ncbi:MAG: hypothetical protein K6T86_12075 [Pirellulales bacterium]|nr:hypothetical protein [Pirellulales bacterium]
MSEPPTWNELLGQEVVLDLASQFVCLGRLAQQQGDYLLLAEADVHDLRDTPTTSREQYVVAARLHGINATRRYVWVALREVVAISRLVDVMAE